MPGYEHDRAHQLQSFWTVKLRNMLQLLTNLQCSLIHCIHVKMHAAARCQFGQPAIIVKLSSALNARLNQVQSTSLAVVPWDLFPFLPLNVTVKRCAFS